MTALESPPPQSPPSGATASRTVQLANVTPAQLLLRYLAMEGATTLFGVPGAAIMQILYELRVQSDTFRYVVTRQETGAAYIADGYARVSDGLGVVLVTSGPGATNALTGTVNADTCGTALLTISGEIKEMFFGMAYLQEGADLSLDVNEVYAAACAYSAMIDNSANFCTLFEQALRDARSVPRRAVHVSLPLDVSQQLMTTVTVPAQPANYRAAPKAGPDGNTTDKVLAALLEAQQPVIMLGNGARRALRGSRSQHLTDFVEKFEIPVMTTPGAKGIFPESHRLSLRNYGLAGCRWTTSYLSGPDGGHPFDALLVIGSNLGELATTVTVPYTYSPALLPHGPFIHVDANPEVIGRTFPVDLGIVADAGATIDALLHAAKGKPVPNSAAARKRLIHEIKKDVAPAPPPPPEPTARDRAPDRADVRAQPVAAIRLAGVLRLRQLRGMVARVPGGRSAQRASLLAVDGSDGLCRRRRDRRQAGPARQPLRRHLRRRSVRDARRRGRDGGAVRSQRDLGGPGRRRSGHGEPGHGAVLPRDELDRLLPERRAGSRRPGHLTRCQGHVGDRRRGAWHRADRRPRGRRERSAGRGRDGGPGGRASVLRSRGAEARRADVTTLEAGHDSLIGYVPPNVRRRLANGLPELPFEERFSGAVLIADISGFTRMTEQVMNRGPEGAETLSDLLNGYFGRLIGCVDDRGGEVVSFAGDGLIAAWPQRSGETLADVLHQATECALVLARTIADHPAVADRPAVGDHRTGDHPGADDITLTVRLGVSAGPLRALELGGVGRRRFSVLGGEPLEAASRASELANAGQVLVDARGRELLGSRATGEHVDAGYVRIRMIEPTPVPRRRVEPLTIEPALLAPFIPPPVVSREGIGQGGWLAELRPVTVVFVNLPRIDHQAEPELVQRAVAELQREFDRCEATISDFTVDAKGTSMLAATGLPPLSHDDDPLRAVRAAMAVARVLTRDGWEAGIGVATGRALCGPIGNRTRREYTMMGSVVNTAARLMVRAVASGSSPVAVLCDAATERATRQRIDWGPRLDVELKGRVGPIAVFEPVRRRTGATPVGRDTVGRGRERDALAEAVELAATGQSQVVVLEGEAGMGKSRLLLETLRGAEATGRRCVSGAGDPIERVAPYHAWRSVFASLLDADESAEPAARAQRAVDALPETLRPLAPLLNLVLGIELPDSEQSRALQGERRTLSRRRFLLQVLAEAASEPLLIGIDDGHWLDSASWALIQELAGRELPVCILLATRPGAGLAPEFDELLAEPATQRISLAPLDPAPVGRDRSRATRGRRPAPDRRRADHREGRWKPALHRRARLRAARQRDDRDRLRALHDRGRTGPRPPSPSPTRSRASSEVASIASSHSPSWCSRSRAPSG